MAPREGPPPYVINDFTPGIRQVRSLNHPPGTAESTNTYGCYASAEGVLRALPKRVSGISPDATRVYDSSIDCTELRICGTLARDPVFYTGNTTGLDQNNTELWMGVEYYDGSGNYLQKVARYKRFLSSPTWETIDSKTQVAAYSATARPARCYFDTTTSKNSAPADPGIPVVCWVFNGWAMFAPDDSTPTATSSRALPVSGGGLLPPDQLVCHQNRAVIFPLFGYGAGTNVIQPDNEAFYWTEVNDLRTLDAALGGAYAKAVAYVEEKHGFEIQARMTSDQLLLIKRRGGGLVLQGDLNDFTAQPLPNLMSPGLSLNRGTNSPVGYFYPVNQSGVYLWEGGDTSRNIAPYMNPSFWRAPAYSPANGSQTANGWGWDFTGCASWQEWVLLPSNWMYDTVTEAWWRLDQAEISSTDHHTDARYWCVDWTGRWAWSSPSGYTNTSSVIFNEYDRTVPASTFTWQSHPLPMSVDQEIAIDEVAVTVESFASGGSVVLTFTTDDTANTKTVTLVPTVGSSSGAFQTLRAPNKIGCRGTNVRVKIVSTATSTGEAHRIHRVAMDWHPVANPTRSA